MTHMKWGEPDPFWEYRGNGLFDTRTTRRTSTGPSTMTDYQIGEPMEDREKDFYVETYEQINRELVRVYEHMIEMKSHLVAIHIMIATISLLVMVAFIFIYIVSRQ